MDLTQAKQSRVGQAPRSKKHMMYVVIILIRDSKIRTLEEATFLEIHEKLIRILEVGLLLHSVYSTEVGILRLVPRRVFRLFSKQTKLSLLRDVSPPRLAPPIGKNRNGRFVAERKAGNGCWNRKPRVAGLLRIKRAVRNIVNFQRQISSKRAS